jgi:hypothetical protein
VSTSPRQAAQYLYFCTSQYLYFCTSQYNLKEEGIGVNEPSTSSSVFVLLYWSVFVLFY